MLRQCKTRISQKCFRNIILGNYHSRCSLTGIAVPDLLIASHIVPWSEDVKNRLNPSNGLCLNALHDKAFDRGLISFDDDCRLLLSGQWAIAVDDWTRDRQDYPGAIECIDWRQT